MNITTIQHDARLRGMHTPAGAWDPATAGHASDEPADPGHRFHPGWFLGWAFLTTFAWFEVIKHGWVNGGTGTAVLLSAVAVGSFIAPDLTFLIGAGQPTPKGHLARRAVPFYNALHRFWVPLAVTTVVGIVFAPLSTGTLAVFVGGLSWMAHIAMDRTAGYGLRNADGSR